MAMPITIKRYNGTTDGWQELYPKTLGTNVFDSTGSTALINSDGKIDNIFIPDWVSSGSVYADTIVGTSSSGHYVYTLSSSTFISALLSSGNNSAMKSKFHNRFNGAYFVIANGTTILTVPRASTLGFTYLDDGQTRTISGVYFFPQGGVTPNNTVEDAETRTVTLESGDMLLIEDAGYTGTERYINLYVINNVYNHADSSEYGIVKLASWNNGLSGADSDVITKSVLTSSLSNYQPSNSKLTSISGLASNVTGLIKLTNGVASVDTTSYITLQDAQQAAEEEVRDHTPNFYYSSADPTADDTKTGDFWIQFASQSSS